MFKVLTGHPAEFVSCLGVENNLILRSLAGVGGWSVVRILLIYKATSKVLLLPAVLPTLSGPILAPEKGAVIASCARYRICGKSNPVSA